VYNKGVSYQELVEKKKAANPEQFEEEIEEKN